MLLSRKKNNKHNKLAISFLTKQSKYVKLLMRLVENYDRVEWHKMINVANPS